MALDDNLLAKAYEDGWRAGQANAATYDSRPETWEHVSQVPALLMLAAHDLTMRGLVHDWSKLQSPEVEVFDEFTPRLRDTPYDSPEYHANLAAMKPALDHHYAVHDHHPEHFGQPTYDFLHGPQEDSVAVGGVFDMSAFHLIEMVADWIAASRRHPDGDARASLPANAARFGYAGTALERTIAGTMEYLLAMEATATPGLHDEAF